jgi:hypothetical protein
MVSDWMGSCGRERPVGAGGGGGFSIHDDRQPCSRLKNDSTAALPAH